jgi:hypothetical protein
MEEKEEKETLVEGLLTQREKTTLKKIGEHKRNYINDFELQS